MNKIIPNQIIYIMAFTAGFSIMAVELVAGKLMAPYFGSSVYVWGSIISIFMLALSFGYLIGGKLSTKNPSIKKYSGIFGVAGLTVCLVPSSYETIFSFASSINDPRYGSLLGALILFTPLSIALGAISPYSIRLLTESNESSGSTAGKLYFVSTMGSALGTIATSFYLVLIFDINTIIYGVGFLLIALALYPLVYSYSFIPNKKKSLALNEAK